MEQENKKSNWGKGIVALYSGFVIFILAIVFIATSQNFDLVESNYYQKELKYQDKIDKLNNSNSLKEKPYWAFDRLNDNLVLFFPEKQYDDSLIGDLHFFRPSDKSLDFHIPLELNDDFKQQISLNGKARGLWRLKINWTNKIDSYFIEDILIIE